MGRERVNLLAYVTFNTKTKNIGLYDDGLTVFKNASGLVPEK